MPFCLCKFFLRTPISSAFSYEDLLKHFLESSYGDSLFSILLLVAAYMNSSLSDALTMRCLLWSTATDVIRQMSIGVKEIVSGLCNQREPVCLRNLSWSMCVLILPIRLRSIASNFPVKCMYCLMPMTKQ